MQKLHRRRQTLVKYTRPVTLSVFILAGLITCLVSRDPFYCGLYAGFLALNTHVVFIREIDRIDRRLIINDRK